MNPERITDYDWKEHCSPGWGFKQYASAPEFYFEAKRVSALETQRRVYAVYKMLPESTFPPYRVFIYEKTTGEYSQIDRVDRPGFDTLADAQTAAAEFDGRNNDV